ncbi:hypothetical protein [Paenibacillus tarimensis]|uniref:hypothetical protein n=1 Tax=Paenibacillus tarimensis TaxID=416012 RepID=UPI001F425DA5|nr:hypothetical protein [Paenibacillus tarimensis]MCF2946467.1 hypothetical protein [Paenibacillus tarimensis]
MKRKALSMGCVVGVSAMLLAGCGGNDNANDNGMTAQGTGNRGGIIRNQANYRDGNAIGMRDNMNNRDNGLFGTGVGTNGGGTGRNNLNTMNPAGTGQTGNGTFGNRTGGVMNGTTAGGMTSTAGDTATRTGNRTGGLGDLFGMNNDDDNMFGRNNGMNTGGNGGGIGSLFGFGDNNRGTGNGTRTGTGTGTGTMTDGGMTGLSTALSIDDQLATLGYHNALVLGNAIFVADDNNGGQNGGSAGGTGTGMGANAGNGTGTSGGRTGMSRTASHARIGSMLSGDTHVFTVSGQESKQALRRVKDKLEQASSLDEGTISTDIRTILKNAKPMSSTDMGMNTGTGTTGMTGNTAGTTRTPGRTATE